MLILFMKVYCTMHNVQLKQTLFHAFIYIKKKYLRNIILNYEIHT